MASPSLPHSLSDEPFAELEKLLARSVELHNETVAVNARIRELYEQMARRKNVPHNDEE